MRELEKLKKKTLSRRAKHRMFSLATIPALMISLDYSLAAQAADQVQAADQEQTRQQSQPDSQPPSAWNALTGLGGLKDNLTLGGFVRTWASMNLQNHPEVANGGAGELQMLRSSLELDAGLKTGPFKWTAIGRLDREILTPYEKSLQDMVRQNTPGGPGSSMLQQYDQNELREFYVDTDVGDRVHLRLGKQQIVWGETDFFHPTDLIQGYDYRWRSFLEPESDELRKPLIMANATVSVPELNGDLQMVVRPGLDRKRDIGNNYDLYGGRWIPQPFKGVDFLSLTNYDYDHPYGKTSSVTGGTRWTGFAGPVNYAMSYLRTFAPDPVLNPSANPIGKTPSGLLGDWFFPTINVFDASVSGEIPVTGTVANLEIAYQPNRYFNTGTNLPINQQGTGPVVRKDVITTTIRLDQKLSLERLLGTNAPSLFSLQLFDTWIQNFKSSDDIVAQVGWSAPAKRHDTLMTAFLTLNYMNSRLNPGIAGGVDLSTGDGFVIPSIGYQIGNHWRLLAEADLFFARHSRSAIPQPGQSTYGLAGFANNDQLMLRATYQF
ncbi:DUF1302 family protein [Paraburkholderia dipogonis]|uniref:DUF1302 family protein n=2 Tax=Paraburkholderia dipogonis TaxID=1211383 RepID=UPI0035EB76E7